VFKAYDVRGTAPGELDAGFAHALGSAFVRVLGTTEVVVGHDMRPSSPELADAFARGAAAAGADTVHIGLAATDQLYFASGRMGRAGAMVTASHNPARYNGFKLCRAGAAPVGEDTGLAAIRDAMGTTPAPGRPGLVSTVDVLADYAGFLLELAPVTGRPLKVVVDAGNGMAGLTAPAVFDRLAGQVTLVPMYFELDGTFPHHEANPIDPENLRDLQRRVVAEGADVGLAFDGDADRCFLVDERGRPVSPSTVTALIAARELAREPGATIIHNLITSRAVPEIVRELGGVPHRTRVGHSFIKATMAQTGAVFGGEHSGHFYFRDFWRADSGMLAALHVLGAAAESEQPLSGLLSRFERYVASGEINSSVPDVAAVLARVRAAYAGRAGVSTDELDGLSVQHADWSFNVRPSNTEPLVRLNAEGKDAATLAEIRNDVLTLIRSDA
jgi:phosphomannomutase